VAESRTKSGCGLRAAARAVRASPNLDFQMRLTRWQRRPIRFSKSDGLHDAVIKLHIHHSNLRQRQTRNTSRNTSEFDLRIHKLILRLGLSLLGLTWPVAACVPNEAVRFS
jgi:hypothetical protein